MPEKTLSFEEALLRLEKIVALLEQGDLSLDDSLRLFEEGIGHIRLCSEELNKAQGKLEILLRANENEVETAPFKGESGVAG